MYFDVILYFVCAILLSNMQLPRYCFMKALYHNSSKQYFEVILLTFIFFNHQYKKIVKL